MIKRSEVEKVRREYYKNFTAEEIQKLEKHRKERQLYAKHQGKTEEEILTYDLKDILVRLYSIYVDKKNKSEAEKIRTRLIKEFQTDPEEPEIFDIHEF
ncbi:hypothetical protein COT72_03650 [archaeon CG10_big_fil_rev_8_21_14_0_10_43_11]|nr:MAG: hypothetical protein COT72_03650 [archaeon CG10_big_fil_rev_8_21_14_0_10_43_11]